MARLAGVFTVIFLLFTFSHARFLDAEPERDVNPEETVTSLPESDPKTANAILLPSEKPGFEPAKVVDFKLDDALETDSDVHSVPLTTISFRPVNRHFPRRPLIPFRHKHNCRFHKRFRPLNPRFQRKRYIPYGDDMLMSDERSRFDPESNDVVRQIQARWVRFPDDGKQSKEDLDFIKPHHHEHDHDDDHHHHHHDEHDHDDDHHHHHHDEHDHDDDHHLENDHDDDHHHHHLRRHHGEEDEMDEREEHEGGFMRRFRKFFLHF